MREIRTSGLKRGEAVALLPLLYSTSNCFARDTDNMRETAVANIRVLPCLSVALVLLGT